MTDRPVDPERPRDGNAFDQPSGYSGQGYDRSHEAAEGARDLDLAGRPADAHPGLPRHNGARAGFDKTTGAVHGAGMGAGGGQAGEDQATEAAAGSGYPLTGGEGGDKTPGDLGPAQREGTSYL